MTADRTIWHTVKTAAKHAKVSVWTIRQAITDGDLPAYTVRTGRAVRLKESDVDSWMEATPYEPGRTA